MPSEDDKRSEDLLGGLPRTRPQRRSARRPSRAGAAGQPASKPAGRRSASAHSRPATPARRPRLSQPPQPAGTPPAPTRRGRVPASGTEIVATAVQAAGELTQIGMALGSRALRSALERVPRP